MGDVTVGRTIVMPVRVVQIVRVLRINPGGVVEQKRKGGHSTIRRTAANRRRGGGRRGD